MELQFDRDGLVPAVIQSAESGRVLMVAFMNREALEATIATGRTHFWSRSRQKLWQKGEESGNGQLVRDIFVNCEDNSLLLVVDQQGGASCHTGYETCYYRRLAADGAWETVGRRVFDPAEVYGRRPPE